MTDNNIQMDQDCRSSKMVKGRTGQHVRLYVRGTILGYKRSKSNQYETTSLVQIEGIIITTTYREVAVAVRPSKIADAQLAGTGEKGGPFVVDGAETANVRLMGMVSGKEERNTDVSFTLDDGIGRIDFIRW